MYIHHIYIYMYIYIYIHNFITWTWCHPVTSKCRAPTVQRWQLWVKEKGTTWRRERCFRVKWDEVKFSAAFQNPGCIICLGGSGGFINFFFCTSVQLYYTPHVLMLVISGFFFTHKMLCLMPKSLVAVPCFTLFDVKHAPLIYWT